MGQGSIVIVGDRIRVADSQKHKQRSKEMIRFDERFVKDINPKKAVQIEYSDGKWWLISVFDRPIEEPPKKKQIVALDPGVRTFQTTYSPDGASKKLGDRASCRIFRMMRYADRLSAFKDKRSKRKRQRLENRIGNIVTEMHWKIARELATEYETIIIPAFETQRMARKWKRKINKTVVRMMLRLAHYKFREKLEHVAKKLGSRVVVVTEEYTSKTCGRCGVVHDKLGGAKKFKCPNCEIRIDRDGNGARNICIKTVAQAAAMT
jgi:putative transposase